MASASSELPVPDSAVPSASSGGAGRRRKRGKGKGKAEAEGVKKTEEDDSLDVLSQAGEGDEVGDAEDKAAHASGTEDGGQIPQGDDQTKEAAVGEAEPPAEAPKKKRHRAGRKHRSKAAAAQEAHETDDTVHAAEETEDLQSVEQVEEQSDAGTSEATQPMVESEDKAADIGGTAEEPGTSREAGPAVETKEVATGEATPPEDVPKKKKTHRAGRRHRAKIAAALEAQETGDAVHTTEETEDQPSPEQTEEQTDIGMSEAPQPATPVARPVDSAAEEVLATAAATPLPEPLDQAEVLEEQLKEKDDELQTLASKYQDLEQERNWLRESFQDAVQRGNASRDKKIGELEERLRTAEHRREENNRYVSEVEEAVAKEQETSASLRREIQSLLASNRSLNQTVSDAAMAQENVAAQHAENLREERAKLSGRERDLARSRDDLELRKHAEDQLKRDLEQANARHATALQEKGQAETALSKIEEEYKRCEADRVEAVNKVDELKGKLSNHQEERQALKDADDEIKSRDRTITGLESSNTRLAYVNKQLSAQVEKGLDLDEETKGQLTAIKAEIAEATDRKTRSASAGGDQYARSREVVAQMSSINGIWFEMVEQLAGRFEELKAENGRLERKVQRLEAEEDDEAGEVEDLPAEADEEGEDPLRITLSDAGRRESTAGTVESLSSIRCPQSVGSAASSPPSSLSPLVSSSPSPSPSPPSSQTSPHSGVSWRVILVFLVLLLPLVFVDISLCITRYREIELWRAANMETLLRFWNTGGGGTISAFNDWRSISAAGCENNLLIAWWGVC